jgi:hypothetical protein
MPSKPVLGRKKVAIVSRSSPSPGYDRNIKSHVKLGSSGETLLVVETKIRPVLFKHVITIDEAHLPRLRELADHEKPGVRQAALAMLLFHETKDLRRTVAETGRSRRWFTTIRRLVRDKGPDALLRHKSHFKSKLGHKVSDPLPRTLRKPL